MPRAKAWQEQHTNHVWGWPQHEGDKNKGERKTGVQLCESSTCSSGKTFRWRCPKTLKEGTVT